MSPAPTAFGGPEVARNDGNQIAWTGSDAAHHLNVAKFAYVVEAVAREGRRAARTMVSPRVSRDRRMASLSTAQLGSAVCGHGR